jgi:26S proteasome regulatory subunit T5
MFETNIRVMKGELVRLQHEARTRENDVKENAEKLKMNKQLPYLVANCIEVLFRR